MPDFKPRHFYLIVADKPLSLDHSSRREKASSEQGTALDVLRDVAFAEEVNFTVSCVSPDDFRETWNATLHEAAETCTYADAVHEAIQEVAGEEGDRGDMWLCDPGGPS
jgi:hypothetical protein